MRGSRPRRPAGWQGARLYQDNVPWKPLGTRPLGFHQDNSYLDFVVTGEMATHRRNSSPVRIVIELRGHLT